MPKLLATIRNQIPLTSYAYQGQDEPCNLCGSHHKITICRTDRRLKTLQTVTCEQCGLIRTDPMPTDAELDAYYAGEYRLDYQFAFSRQPPRYHLKRSQRSAEALYALLRPAFSRSQRLLDFGSGSGEFLALAASQGHHVQGIEPGEMFASFARDTHGVTVTNCVWQQASYAAGSFDIITANQVLEHLREPVSALKQMAQWLADDGVLLVAVPNAFAQRNHSFQHFHFAHVYNFTPQTLVWAGMIAGLEPDPRFDSAGTTLVFRKRRDGPVVPAWGKGQGMIVAAHFQQSSPVRFLFSGRWIVDALRRAHKVVRDMRRPSWSPSRSAARRADVPKQKLAPQQS